MDEKLCTLKHQSIDIKLKEHDEKLKEHDDKIDTLEKSDAVHSNQIESLCKELDSQTNALWALALAIVSALLTFLFSKF
jgi:uncharacterized protein (DUF3084 family)